MSLKVRLFLSPVLPLSQLVAQRADEITSDPPEVERHHLVAMTIPIEQ